MFYAVLKILHIIGATVIFGTGSGIAFFMLMAHLTQDAAFVARTARVVVIADWLFTATAVAAQPVTGYLLMRQTDVEFHDSWMAVSLALYAVAGIFWLPVIWMQAQMRDLAAEAASRNAPLPPRYQRLFRQWFLCGFPGFGAVLAIIVLMVVKPVLY